MPLNFFLPFISIPIFTRILTPKDYGLLAMAMIYASFINGFVNLGITLAFERNYFKYIKDKQKISELFFSSIVFVSINFVFLAGITYFFKDNISLFLTKEREHGILILAALAAHFFSGTAISFYFTYFKNAERAISLQNTEF